MRRGVEVTVEHPAADLDRLIDDLEALDPPPVLLAIGDDGLFLPIPDRLRGRVAEADGRSWVDLIRPEDRAAVIEAFGRAKEAGQASLALSYPEVGAEAIELRFIDARAEHACFLVVVSGIPGEVSREVVDLPVMRPRLAWSLKSTLGDIVDIDEAFTAMLGWERDALQGRLSLDLIHPDDRERALRAWMALLADPERPHRVRARHQCGDGSWLWVEITNRLLPADEGAASVVASEVVDVADEMAAQEALRDRERLFHGLAESLPLGLIQADLAGRITYTNGLLPTIVGVPAAATIHEQLRRVVDEDQGLLADALEAILAGASDADVEVRVSVPEEGTLRWCRLSIRPVVDDLGTTTGSIVCVADVTDDARMRAELEHQATFDALTGCHNRASVMLNLGGSLRRNDAATTVLFVDLDRFKSVNDLYGHAAGDELLVVTVERLRHLVRAQDTIGRIGGDEFLVVCPGVSSPTDALALAGDVAVGLSQPITVAGHPVEVVASVGVATSRPGTSGAALVAEADAAMYASKRAGLGLPVLHEAIRDRGRARREVTAPALRRALARGELAVDLQPVAELATGRTIGHEALVRWQQGENRVPAEHFIDLAEASGLIIEIGTWVRDEVCRQRLAARPAIDDDQLWFVNVSSLELAVPGMAVGLADSLDRHGLDPRSLVIEVTEHAGLADGDIAHRTFQELRELGVGLALDDFGTGWSSLSLLRTIPVGWLKVDRSFLTDLSAGVDRHLVHAVIDLARRLSIDVIIEGVENPNQVQQLLALGATLAQGNLLGAPQPLEALLAGR